MGRGVVTSLAVAVAVAACADAGVHTESAAARPEATSPPLIEPVSTLDPPATEPPATAAPPTTAARTDPPVTDPPVSEAPASTASPPSSVPTTTGAGAGAEPSTSTGDSLFPELGSDDLDVQAYDVRLTYDPATEDLGGAVAITTAVTRPVEAVVFDAAELTVDVVTVGGAAVAFTHREEELVVDPPGLVTPGTPIVVEIAYTDEPGLGGSGGLGTGLGWFPTPTGSFVLNEPDGAHTWLPSHDHPADKATWRFELTVPAGTAAIANGHLVEQREGEGTTTWVWEQRQPMATYLIQVLTGEYEVVDGGSYGAVPLVHVALAHDVERMRPYFDLTDDQLAFFEPVFGPYPLDQYGLAFTESYPGLAMETQGRSLFARDDFSGQLGFVEHLLLSHELAHQWFGNAVTPADWSDLWLNESFASYGQWLWFEHVGLQPVEEQAEQNLAMRQQPTEPTGEPTAENLFGYERYDGGAVVLHALRREIGDDAFFALLQRWVAENAGTSRTTEDFTALAEVVAGRPLADFFAAWLYAPAVPAEYPP